MSAPWLTRLACAGALLLFALPLFVGLDRWDLRNDEAIYSYAVERMLDTGDWLTPRYIPTDFEFLEKPPLKMWIVAGLMKVGLLPRDELGMRVVDAVFGTLVFAYVLAFGVRLAGPIAGAVALLILFTFWPLLFDHGLRSNNMDAALMLAYAGGLWHATRWADAPTRRTRDAWLTAAFFVLGFMTKYVAVIFMPAIAVAAWLWRPGGAHLVAGHWRRWLVPAVTAVAVISPWFAYQSAVYGWDFWNELLGHQVYARFTAGVDPSHLEPWHFYLSATWGHLARAGSAWFVAAGAVLVVWRAFVRVDLTTRLFVLWFVLPIAAISLGSSKLLHYVYPFLPPLALAGGLAVSTFLALADRGAHHVASRMSRLPQTTLGDVLERHRRLIATVGVCAVGLAVWTFFIGPVNFEIGSTRVFRNSSALRPAAIGAVLLATSGAVRFVVQGIAAALVLLALPLPTYTENLATARSFDRPLRTLASCLVEESRGSDAPGVFVDNPAVLGHPFYYYLRHTGPWQTEGVALDEVQRRILDGNPASLVLLQRSTWEAARARTGASGDGVSMTPLLDAGLDVPDYRVLLVPVRYWSCLARAIEAGGVQVEHGSGGASGS